jgi:hypothetical protein
VLDKKSAVYANTSDARWIEVDRQKRRFRDSNWHEQKLWNYSQREERETGMKIARRAMHGPLCGPGGFGLCSDVQRRSATFSDVQRRSATFSDVQRRSATFSDVQRRSATFSDVQRHCFLKA